ncbi:hypothetical protein BKA61DRAFT_59906 [Leptodontidium sp. MPI-SDFR-AT-0119]|nr:hypothetical protein BKA61DRAFT_59906 [Leptodontidium sp. MPI-SDFR-AT-0119]
MMSTRLSFGLRDLSCKLLPTSKFIAQIHRQDIIMLNKFVLTLCFVLFSINHIQAQDSTISVGPLLTCGLTTFSCPAGGCCTIGGCCGSGCCANGYACINEGTSSEACCPSFDTTKCGTEPLPSSPPSPSGSGDHTCTAMQACPGIASDPTSTLGWTCFLGRTCGFSYRECRPCPYLLEIGSGSSTSSFEDSVPATSTSSIDDSGLSTSSFEDSVPATSTSSTDSTPTTPLSNSSTTTSSSSPTTPLTNSGTTTTSSSGSSQSSASSATSGRRFGGHRFELYWVAAVVVYDIAF